MPRLPQLLGLLLVLIGCGLWDARAAPEHSAGTASDTSAVAEPDMEQVLRLPERSFPLLIWSAYLVQQDYFDPQRFDARRQLLSAARFMGLRTPEFFSRELGDTLAVTVRSSRAEFSLDGLADLRSAAERLEKILEFAQSVLDLEAEALHELEYLAINGLFAPLDPHTILLTPEQSADLGVRTKGQFGGIGAEIRAEDRRIRIVRVLSGRPAARAGVEGGDVILQIGGESTVNMDAEEAQALLRGPVGTPVEVKLRRGKRALTVVITREVIRIDSVIATALPGNIVHLNVGAFQEDTAKRFAEALQGSPSPRGVIIDLRGNSGGLLTQATAIVDQFVDRGELVVVRSGADRQADPAKAGMSVPKSTAVVVLIDEQAASASEIVSGGLQALGRGVVLGRTSFGKGTVQMLKNATPYGRELAMKVTVAEYLVAGDVRIQSVGVIPDLALDPVELTNVRGVVRYFDTERFERARERARTAHFPSAKHDQQPGPVPRPKQRLRYLWTNELSPELRERVVDEIAPPGPALDALTDPEIRIAHAAAASLAGAMDVEGRAARLQTLSRELGDRESARVTEALGRDRIEWTEGEGPTKPGELELSARVMDKGKIQAGDTFVLRLRVRNAGSRPVHRVHAITDCVHEELDGIEMLIGSVAPGRTEARDLRLHVMSWHSSFVDELRIDVHAGEPGIQPTARAQVMLHVEGAPRPFLSYDYWIVDDPDLAKHAPHRPQPLRIAGEAQFSVRGNGDGVLQPGERVLLAFEANNSGSGRSPDVRAVLRNLTGKQGLLEEGLVPLGALRSGAKRSGAFGLSVAQNADPTVPVELDLLVGDAHLRTGARDKLRLRIVPRDERVTPASGSVTVGSDGGRLYHGAHASTPVVGTVPAGAALPVVGTIDGWWAIELDRGRRAFVPKDVAKLAANEGAQVAVPSRIVAVAPPRVDIEPLQSSTMDPTIRITGRARHDVRVRDVVVSVLPPGPARIERKVHYAANPSARGSEPTSMGFAVEVPLELGGNRISIIARDGRKVETQRYVWVYRSESEGARR